MLNETSHTEIGRDMTVSYNTETNALGWYHEDRWHDWDWHSNYVHTVYKEDKVSKSFKIIQALMKKKIIKELTVPDFIELVNEISKEL